MLYILLYLTVYECFLSNREICSHKASVTPPLYFYWSACTKPGKWAVVCLLDFGAVPKGWYFSLSLLWQHYISLCTDTQSLFCFNKDWVMLSSQPIFYINRSMLKKRTLYSKISCILCILFYFKFSSIYLVHK